MTLDQYAADIKEITETILEQHLEYLRSVEILVEKAVQAGLEPTMLESIATAQMMILQREIERLS